MREVRPWSPAPWPTDGIDPFDPSPSATYWMAATNYRVSRAFPAGDWRDFGDYRSSVDHPTAFADLVPMGYTGLYGLERLAVCRAGVVAGEWPPTDAETEAPHHRPGLPAAWIVHHLELDEPYWRSRSASRPSYDEAVDLARELSRTGGLRTTVSRRLRSMDWH